MPKSVGITGNHGLLEFDPQTGQVLSTETSCSSECSCKGGGETAMAFDPKEYEKVLREAVEAAIDSPDLYVRGILYQDDMKEFVRQRLGDADRVVEKFLGIIDDPHKEPDGLGRGKQIVEDLKKQPRGTWLVIKHDFQDNRDFRFTAYISAGNGKLGGIETLSPKSLLLRKSVIAWWGTKSMRCARKSNRNVRLWQAKRRSKIGALPPGRRSKMFAFTRKSSPTRR